MAQRQMNSSVGLLTILSSCAKLGLGYRVVGHPGVRCLDLGTVLTRKQGQLPSFLGYARAGDRGERL
jgi:hypothetical protein